MDFDETILEKMLTTMRHRGPDGKGHYSVGDICVLHTRLSVTDHTGGAQPMILDWGGERYVICFDGVLYNTEELRLELMQLGHSFDGHSDTEVVLHAYVQWKEKVLDKINGVFALAILQERNGRVFLARDRIGVKPLFYMHHGQGLLFASEMKTILSYPGVKAELDEDGIHQLLLLGPGRQPGSGVFHNMQELEPGCYGYYEKGKLHISRYWKLTDRIHTESFEDTVEHVRDLVLDAIRRQMVADVPIGTFLSGGLDSSIISAICGRELDAQGKTLDTFSLDYEHNDQYFHPGRFQPNSDTEYIGIMQAHLDTHHHWTVLSSEILMEHMQQATIARDLPGMADIDSSLLVFCGQIRPHVKVVLSGECADEIFGGYPWFRDPGICMKDGFPWAQNAEQRAALLHPYFRERVDAYQFVSALYQETLSQCDILPENSLQEKCMKQMVNLNFRWFMQTLLDRKDRMSMQHGLQARVPFCDYRIAEYLYGVPWQYKDYRGYEKGLLRYAMRGVLPEAVLYRKKSPYPKTHDPKFLQMAQQKMEQLLQSKNAPLFNIVDRKAVGELVQKEFNTPWYGQLMQLPQTLVYLLQINFWLEHYSVQIR